MKKRILSTLLALCMLLALLPGKAWAATYNKDFVIEGNVFAKYNGTDPVVVIPDGITKIGERAFESNPYVETIILSNSVETAEKMAFAYMPNLQEFHIGANLGGMWTCVFTNTPKLKTFVISPANKEYYVQDGVLRQKNSSTIDYFPGGRTDPYYRIPDGVTYVNFDSNPYLERVYIPASVSLIDLSCTSSLKYIEVDPDSPYFCSVDNVLYNRNMTKLVRYPSAKTDSYFAVPKDVIFDDCWYNIFPNTPYLTDIYFNDACSNREGSSIPFYRWYAAFEPTHKYATEYYRMKCGDKMSDKVYRIHYPASERDSWSELEQQYENKWELGRYFELQFIAEDINDPGPVFYTITFDANGGSVTPDTLATSADGTLLDIPTPTHVGYIFNGWYTANGSGTKITKDTVFSENTIVYAQWIKDDGNSPNDGPSGNGGNGGGGGGVSITSNVTLPTTSNGSVSISPQSPKTGDTVTVTVKPDNRYELKDLTVKDNSGKEITMTKVNDTIYAFTMPVGKVSVYSSFAKAEEGPSGIVFTDVPKDAYYADAVTWAVSNDITTGTSATTFNPNNPCTRAQIVTFLWRAAGAPESSGGNPFTDMATGSYYYDAVQWAVAQGITTGTTSTTFSPDTPCTRGQAVTFIHRANSSPKGNEESSFVDVASDAYYADAVQWVVSNGITNGTGTNKFSPNSSCTRAQIVTFLYRDRTK